MGGSGSKNKTSSRVQSDKPVEFSTIEEDIATGDLAVLYREDSTTPQFGVFIQHDDEETDFPLMLVKGKSKPLPFEKFKPTGKRTATPVTAVARIFYGDFSKVAIYRSVLASAGKSALSFKDATSLFEEVENIPFDAKEIAAIKDVQSSSDRSALLTAFMVAHFYKRLDILHGDPSDTTPFSLTEMLQLSNPTYITVPPLKPGPVINKDPPLLMKLLDGLSPPPDIYPVPYNDATADLDTGDIVLFSGCTSSGAVIRFFDSSQFSHVGLVIKYPFTSKIFVWESTPNQNGVKDIESGKVINGVQVVPLHHKVFSGWENRVAVRKLTGIDAEKRAAIRKELLKLHKEVHGRPYEKNTLDLIRSSFDFQEEFLEFLQNEEEDLSSIFCSELVAQAYVRVGLLNDDKVTSEYTPDNFTSTSGLKLNYGNLEKEVFIEMKLQ